MKQRGNRIEYIGKHGCDDITNGKTRQAYKRAAETFADWFSEVKGIKYHGQMGKAGYGDFRAALDDFAADLVSGAYCKANGSHYSPATISLYVKGACHAFGVNFKTLNTRLPKRSADAIIKGRDRSANPQGRREEQDPKYERFILLSNVTGARRSELARIRGRNLVTDESGHLCIEIEKGKGGKHQLQRVMPWEQSAVKELFNGIRPKDFVLTRAETSNKIDVHYIRAKRSQICYDYYLAQIEAGGADRIRSELLARWAADHVKGDTTKDRAALGRFRKELRNGSPYKLRGANRRTAEANGRPTEYNRLAMMAVSVFCLSHWRLDVTSVNYLSR